MKKWLVTLFLVAGLKLCAQTSEEQKTFDYYLELISELSQREGEEGKEGEDAEDNDLAFELTSLWDSPVDINTADAYEFSRLFWLNEYQLNNLISYVRKQKPVVSLYELAYIPGFDSTLALSLKPFIRINNSLDLYTRSNPSKHWFLYRYGQVMEKQEGYTSHKFEGDRSKQNLRYKYQYGDKIMAGLHLEKDAGEAMFYGSNKRGPDYYSGYIRIHNPGKIKTLCLGNYSIGFGQGLVAGPGFILGKSTLAVNVIQKESGIKAYTSSNENRYMQGLASVIDFKPLEISVFLSYKKIDANITLKDSLGNIKEVSSLQNTGYHSIKSEIEDENSLGELSAGGRVLFKQARFHAGVSFVTSKFDATILPTPTNYNQYYFRGDTHSNIGFDYKLNLGNTVLFGEEAFDSNGNPAFLNGLTSNIGNRLQLSLLHRYYSRAYHAFYGNGFGEGSRVQNEEGIYAGFTLSVLRKIHLSFYADFFRFPWLKFETDAPSNGREYMIKADYNIGGLFSAYVQFRNKQKQTNDPDSTNTINKIQYSTSNQLRFHCSYKVFQNLSLSTRFEAGSYGVAERRNEKSYLIYQDARVTFRRCPWQLNFRYAVFRSDSYDSRIYAYENDVLYFFSVNAYYMRGQRYYAVIKYSPFKKIDFWIRYSRSIFPDEKKIGSGLNEINGNTRSDFRLQAIFKF